MDVALAKDEGFSLLTLQLLSLTIATSIKLFYMFVFRGGIKKQKKQACSYPADLSALLGTDGTKHIDVSRL